MTVTLIDATMIDAAIIATAGHVDHGKSSLVRLLTGQDPDTLAAEQRRGLTIELGHQWLDLLGVGLVSLVDAPGHEDFLGTTVAGLNAATAVMLVVAADEGWSAQTTQHLAAIRALGHDRVALIITKTDRADPASALSSALERLRGVGLTPVAHACVSAKARVGIPELLVALSALARRPEGAIASHGSPRLWVDRSFTLRGIGTVVTGTLHEGALAVGDHLVHGGHGLRVRGMQRHGSELSVVTGPARVALNLAGVSPQDVPRGSQLTMPGDELITRISGHLRPVDEAHRRWPRELLVALGTTSMAARLTVIDGRAHVRLPHPYVVRSGDRMLLRDPGGRVVMGGVEIDRVGPPPRRSPATSNEVPAPVAVASGDQALLDHLRVHPWQPPTRPQVAQWEVSAASLRRLGAEGKILYLGEGIALGRPVFDEAWDAIDAIEQPFTPGQARVCWGTSRRVTLALLAHLRRGHRVAGDPQRGWYTVAVH